MRTTVLLILSALLLAGCGDPVKEEVIHYKKQLAAILFFADTTKTGFQMVQKMPDFGPNTRTDVIPKYQEKMADLQAIHPKNETIRRIHEQLIECQQKQIDGFFMVAAVKEHQSGVTPDQAGAAMQEAILCQGRCLNELTEFGAKHGVK